MTEEQKQRALIRMHNSYRLPIGAKVVIEDWHWRTVLTTVRLPPLRQLVLEVPDWHTTQSLTRTERYILLTPSSSCRYQFSTNSRRQHDNSNMEDKVGRDKDNPLSTINRMGVHSKTQATR